VGLTCNIDALGKRARLLGGIVGVVIAAIVAGLAFVTGIWWLWIVAAGLALGGGFAIFEARAGWCALRAMGFKTRI
jgi:hypothetical protein